MSAQLKTQTLADFLVKYPINLTLVEVPENPQMEGSDKMLNYYVTLEREGRTMKLYFSTGCGWVEKLNGKPAPMVEYDKVNKRFLQRDFGRNLREADEFGWGGSKYRIRKPVIADVLDCLASDASGIDQSFEDWASGLGYDTDSRRAEETYRTCRKQACELRELLGASVFDELLNHTERQ